MKFIGRQAELALLQQHYRDARPALIPIYGRRRVGKSRLIDEFIKDKPNIYFLGKRTTAELNSSAQAPAASFSDFTFRYRPCSQPPPFSGRDSRVIRKGYFTIEMTDDSRTFSP